jgi:NADPH:quinone reductase-like Zn-dependent oxidoreductase
MVGGTSEGRWVGPFGRIFRSLVSSWFVSQTFLMFMPRTSAKDLALLGDLIEAGTIAPVIDRRYALGEVPEAIRYLEEGHARGKVVISV